MKCYCNLGSPDTPIQCENEAKWHYHDANGKLSDTFLCDLHADDADNNSLVQLHNLIKLKLDT